MSKKKIKLFFFHNVFDIVDPVEESAKRSRILVFLARAGIKGKYLQASVFFGIGLMLIVVFGIFWFTEYAFTVKGNVLGQVQSAITYLKSGQEKAGNDRVDLATIDFTYSFDNLSAAQKELKESGRLLNILRSATSVGQDAEKIIEAVKSISSAAKISSSLIESYQKVNFDLTGKTAGNSSDNFLLNSEERVFEVFKEIDNADRLLSEIRLESLDLKSKEQLIDAKQKVSRIREILVSVEDLLIIMRGFFLGNKNVLILFQNNRELRPTGGFLGTYGNLNLSHGQIKRIKVSSIYDLDGQLKQVVIPPEPIFAVNSRWFMRDSNWFIDFSESAKKVSVFYEREGGETPDFVIALTPELVVRLLKVTGPIELPGYKVVLDAENFIEQTEYFTSVAYDKQVNAPKALIADFIPLLLDKMFKAGGDKRAAMLQVVHQLLGEKHVLLFSQDLQVQKLFEKYGWAGRISLSDGDYLNVTVTNLGGTKTDLDIEQKISLLSEVSEEGQIINTLKVKRRNPLENKKDFENKSFIRVLVPEGSKFISAVGFDTAPFDSGQLEKKGQPDPDVVTQEQASVIDFQSKTVIGKEAGHAVFGNWQILGGGEEKEFTIRYKLPNVIHFPSRLGVLVQNQPGGRPGKFYYRINIQGSHKIESFTEGDFEVGVKEASAEFILNHDLWFGSVLN